jgi:hypothetical protein
MTLTEEQVEWIVIEVLRRLGVVGDNRGRVAGDERSTSPAGGELVIADRVVTLRLIEGRLTDVKRLVVVPRAVITPAVKDELKRRQIETVHAADKNVCPT